MSSLRKTSLFTRPVVALLPSGDGFVQVPFKATFKLLPTSAIHGRKDGEILKDALVRVDDLKDENDQPLSSEEAIADVINCGPASAATINIYVQETTKVEAGNSKK